MIPITAYAVFLVFMLGLAWYPCYCAANLTPPVCSFCTNDSTYVTVTIGGLADSYCDRCNEDWNGTYVLRRDELDHCRWDYADNEKICKSGTCNGGLLLTLNALWLYPGGVTLSGWLLQIALNSTSAVSGCSVSFYDYVFYYWTSADYNDFDCTATRSLSFNHQSLGGGAMYQVCSNYSGLTVTVN